MKCDCLKLIFFIGLSWLFLLSINHLNPTSKFSHYELNYDNFKRDYDLFEESAIQAKKELEIWYSETNHKGFLFDLNQTNYLCVGVMSKNRIGTTYQNYIHQALMSILTRISFHRQDKVRLVAFNMEENPIENFNLLEFKHLIRIENMASGLKGTDKKTIEALDYSYCMKYFINLSCEYSLFVEDDAIFAENWFEILYKELNKLDESNKNNWLMLKLFTGMIFVNNDWMEWKYSRIIIKVSFYSICVSFIQIYLFQNFLKLLNPNYKISKCCIFILILNSIYQSCFFNSTSTTPFGPGVRPQTTGFGAVAVLYPLNKLKLFSDYLERTVNNYVSGKSTFYGPKDILMDIFRVQNKLDELIIEPSLVQHTGMHSSLEVRNTTDYGYKKMHRSFTFIDNLNTLKFKNPNKIF